MFAGSSPFVRLFCALLFVSCCLVGGVSEGLPGKKGPNTIAALQSVAEAAGKMPRYVFLISIDGWAYRHLWSKKLQMPNLRKLAKSGIWGDSRTVFPSMTWASHATIASGLHPRRHGVLGNRWFKGHKSIMIPSWDNLEKGRDTATIYDLAHAAGMNPAALVWPGTQGAKTLTYNIPELTRGWLVRRYIKGKTKRMILRSPRYSYRSVHRVLYGENDRTDKLVVHFTKRLLRKAPAERPRLFMLHFLGLDHTQHHAGTDANRAVKRAARLVDYRVGEVIAAVKKAGIYKQSTFFVVSDHGFLPVTRQIDARLALRRAGLSRRVSFNSKTASRERVVAFRNGHAAFIYLKKNKKDKRYKPLLRRVSKLFKKIPEVEAVMLPSSYASVGLPTPAEDAGSPDLIILAKPHAYFGSNRRRVVRKISSTGAHGYLPNHPGMWVPFIAAGAGIRPANKIRRRHSIHNVDIAPTIARLLALEWPSRPDGRVLHEIIKPTTQRAVASILRLRKRSRIRRALLASAKSKEKERNAN